jgi:hypothetical protein
VTSVVLERLSPSVKQGVLKYQSFFNPKITQMPPAKKWAGALEKGPHSCVISGKEGIVFT